MTAFDMNEITMRVESPAAVSALLHHVVVVVPRDCIVEPIHEIVTPFQSQLVAFPGRGRMVPRILQFRILWLQSFGNQYQILEEWRFLRIRPPILLGQVFLLVVPLFLAVGNMDVDAGRTVLSTADVADYCLWLLED